MNPSTSSGQIVIILLLVMVVSLAIGLSVIGRSMTEISTAANSENASRAFSAAEAGIEKLLYDNSIGDVVGTGTTAINKLTNQSQAEVSWDANLPKSALALEYPPFGKESFAQFWLANPKNSPPSKSYESSSFDLYFGDPNYDYASNLNNYPAIEVRVISSTAVGYTDILKVFDSSCASGTCTRSGFPSCTRTPPPIQTNNNPDTKKSSFLCKITVSGYPTNYPVMARVRMLYTNITHPVALKPATGSSLPPQANIFNSKGSSGNVQRNLQVFQEVNFMPQIFDYAVFSLGELNKTQ